MCMYIYIYIYIDVYIYIYIYIYICIYIVDKEAVLDKYCQTGDSCRRPAAVLLPRKEDVALGGIVSNSLSLSLYINMILFRWPIY